MNELFINEVCFRCEDDFFTCPISDNEDIDYCKKYQVKQLKESNPHWIAKEWNSNHARFWICSECKAEVDVGYYTRRMDYDYCPYCGTEMVGEYE